MSGYEDTLKIETIIDIIKRGECVPFLGAGVNAGNNGYKGLPIGVEVCEKFVEQFPAIFTWERILENEYEQKRLKNFFFNIGINWIWSAEFKKKDDKTIEVHDHYPIPLDFLYLTLNDNETKVKITYNLNGKHFPFDENLDENKTINLIQQHLIKLYNIKWITKLNFNKRSDNSLHLSYGKKSISLVYIINENRWKLEINDFRTNEFNVRKNIETKQKDIFPKFKERDAYDLSRISLQYEVRKNRQGLITVLRDIIDDYQCEPSLLLEKLAEKKLDLIVTTNFDRLLEKAFKKANIDYIEYIQSKDDYYPKDDKQKKEDERKCIIYKMHGTFYEKLFSWDEITKNETNKSKLIEYIEKKYGKNETKWIQPNQKFEDIGNNTIALYLEQYLFNWDDILEEKTEVFKKNFIEIFDWEWVNTAQFTKIDDMTINISDGRNSILLKLNQDQTKVNFEYGNIPYDLIAKKENNKVNIYHNKNKKIEISLNNEKTIATMKTHDKEIKLDVKKRNENKYCLDVYAPYEENPIIITEDDYIKFLTVALGTKGIPDFMRNKLLNKKLVFMGYSLEDWDFRAIYKVFIEEQEKKNECYAILKDPADYWVEFWERKGIKIINEDLHELAKRL